MRLRRVSVIAQHAWLPTRWFADARGVVPTGAARLEAMTAAHPGKRSAWQAG